ncbi:MAG: DUF433 domain-containing protein [Deltaproteobacteria bacterium]|nr:DUF433 domain-containing protein [Deltaproteobacteria bacterium]
MHYRERITIEAGKRGGEPCIRGLRITVHDVLDYLAGGMSEDEILTDLPDLECEDIRAALAFGADRERRLGADPSYWTTSPQQRTPVYERGLPNGRLKRAPARKSARGARQRTGNPPGASQEQVRSPASRSH